MLRYSLRPLTSLPSASLSFFRCLIRLSRELQIEHITRLDDDCADEVQHWLVWTHVKSPPRVCDLYVLCRRLCPYGNRSIAAHGDTIPTHATAFCCRRAPPHSPEVRHAASCSATTKYLIRSYPAAAIVIALGACLCLHFLV